MATQLNPGEREALAGEIAAVYGTPYRFIKSTGIGRSTVYQVLAGTYPGDVARQVRRIRAALAGKGDLAVEVLRAIRRVHCGRCAVRETALCQRCAGLQDDLAAAVLDVFSQLG